MVCRLFQTNSLILLYRATADKFAYDRFPNKGFDIIRWLFVIIQVIINIVLWFSVCRLFIFKTRTNKQGIRKLENGTKI
uniref:Uncharacterized protein n=1 Tax=Acrobeloides nanus TaxID=290746 RepID=A0A914CHF3_9BILA